MTVINDILDYSKIEARKVTLEHVDFDLRATLQQTIELLEVKARQKGLDLTCQVAREHPRRCGAIPFACIRFWLTWSGNAVKFTAQGRVAVRVAVENADDRWATLRFTIADTGIGIAHDQAEILFSPFVQADGSTTRKYGGTGLGLSIAKQLIELMDGRIRVESQLNEGSTFWFTARFEKQGVTEVATETRISGVSNEGVANRDRLRLQPGTIVTNRPLRVLLAEDNLTNQDVALAMLSRLGCRTDLARNGAEVIKALQSADYDVVLMDCEMPELDGYEATRQIRQSATGTRNPRIPIIAITADAMAGDRDRCIQAGMDDYLSKPIELAGLAGVLSKWHISFTSEDRVNPADHNVVDEQAIFDEKQLLKRLMGDRDLAGKLVSGFLQDIPAKLSDLTQLLGTGNMLGAKLQAHSLKGAAATISAGALRDIADELQQAATVNDLEASADLLPRVKQQFALLKTTLENSGWA